MSRELTLWRQAAGGRRGPHMEWEVIPGMLAIVDDCYYRACCFREDGSPIYWGIRQRKTTGVLEGVRCMCNGRRVNLQHFIWHLAGRTLPVSPMTIDHKDRNVFNNCLENLRELDRSGQNINRSCAGGTSEHRGVCWQKRTRKWQGQINKDKKPFYLSLYPTELEAAYAYNLAALIVHGELAQLNAIPAGSITPTRMNEIRLHVEQKAGNPN